MSDLKSMIEKKIDCFRTHPSKISDDRFLIGITTEYVCFVGIPIDDVTSQSGESVVLGQHVYDRNSREIIWGMFRENEENLQ